MRTYWKFIIIAIFTSFAFWIPIWLPFAETKNIQAGEAYQIIAIYSLLVVILEYPTGVIGDVYSHKLSTILGFLFSCLSSIVLIFSRNSAELIVGISLSALSTSLISGSDQAYFHNILGENYRKIYPLMKNAGLVATLIGISVGTMLYKINPAIPLVANTAAIIVALCIFIFLPPETKVATPEKQHANPFYTAKLGIKVLFSSRNIQTILIIYAIIFAFSNNLKWLYGNLLNMVHLPVEFWGTIIALFYLGRFLGIQLQKRLAGKKAMIALLIALANLIFLLGFIYNQVLILVVIFVIMLIIGVVETDLEIDLQENTPNEVRSSILSLRSLIGRLAAAIYIYIIGLLAEPDSVTKMAVTTFALILFTIGIQISSYIKKKEISL